MQKKLIALAIAGLSGAAFAQSNVTIYGVADADFQSASATGGTQNTAGTLTGINQGSMSRINSNSSLIGFKGAESLGNGMTAVFQYESYVNLDGNGSANATASAGGLLGAQRDTFVGLAGGFGTVAMGFLSGPYRNAVVSFEMAPGATGNSATVVNVAGKALISPGTVGNANGTTGSSTLLTTATRVQNTLAYITPNFSGLQGVFAYSTGPIAAESKTPDPLAANNTSVNPTAWTAGLNYDNGPLMVRAAYQSIKSAAAIGSADVTFNANGESTGNVANNRSANGSKIDSWILGAGYKFGDLKVNLAYDHNKVTAGNDPNGVGAVTTLAANNFRLNDTTQKVWILSGMYTAGANDFILEYARSTSTVNGVFGAGSAATTNFKGQSDQGANAWTLRYDYNLSKRTMLYAYWTQINNQGNAGYDYTVGGIRGAVVGNGQDPRTIAAGLRHTF